MSIQYLQTEIEKGLADTVPHGMREGVARVTGIYPAIVSAYFSPDNERQSPAFRLLMIQAALDELSPADGEAHWQKIVEFREGSRRHEYKSGPLSVEHELGNLSKEFTDIIVAKCEGKPVVEQLREIADAERQITKYKEAVHAQIGQTRDAVERVN